MNSTDPYGYEEALSLKMLFGDEEVGEIIMAGTDVPDETIREVSRFPD